MVCQKKNRHVTATVSSIALATLTLAAHAEPSWTLLATDGPSSRYATSMVYDSCRGVTVLFGGYDVSGKLGDTWERDCSGWTLRATTGPSPRVMNAMAFDENRCVVVLFGGVEEPGEVGDYLNDTWEWDGTSWTEKCQNCPPTTRNSGGMVYDSTRQVVLLFGGYAPGLLNDTWEWNGTDWTQVFTTTRPSRRSDFAMAYDHARNRTVVFGGSLQPVLCGARSDETWELDMSVSPATWTQVATSIQPSPRETTMVYDSARSVMVLFGGTEACPSVSNLGDTWEYDGTTWSPLATPTAPLPRHSYALAFDSIREEVILFGGASSPTSPVPTGEVLGGTWTFGEPPPCDDFEDVVIDIKPGSDPNSINLGSHGVVPVAILTTDEFDATTVDPDTIELAGASIALRGNGSRLLASYDDVDDDGDVDLMLHVETENLQFETGATEAILTGKTFDGRDISGKDTIVIVNE